jgi:CDP-glycerol glycerophosphotransferase (TagB/SpsB family)
MFQNIIREKCYFLISEQSPDWQRLKNDGFNLVKFGSLAHRLALLNAKYLLSSHANPAIVNYLPRKYYADIMKYKFVFLQHGITKDDQSEWLNSRKIDYLVTAARHEFSDISGRGRYRYTSQETILTGFPRYDNLKNRDESKKQILIMPTWRKSLAGELIRKSSKRVKNPEFINSLFCEMWGGFLRSEQLRKTTEDYGYSIIFLPHPNLTDYLSELAIPDYIQVGDLTSCSIQEIFKDADLLITDYSSVAFDVAYMKKPIIYFQFDSATFFSEHSYSKGYYDYEELGFGPVVGDIDTLNAELKNTLANKSILTLFMIKELNPSFLMMIITTLRVSSTD